MLNRIVTRWVLSSAGLLATAAIVACGLVTAPVSLPEAFSHNGDLSLHGSISDDQGNPLDQVIVNVDREYYLWHASDSYMEYSKLVLAADHNFQIGPMRAHQLTFTFTKPGYLEQHITVNQQNQTAYAMNLYTWPAQDVKIILPKAGRASAPLNTLDVAVDYTDPDKLPAMNLGQAPFDALPGGRTLQAHPEFFDARTTTFPPGYLCADVQRQPLRTTGADHRVDPLDVNLPARLTLHFSDPDGGFSRFTPSPGTSIFQQMGQAPEAGYSAELALDAARLRKLRDPASQFVLDRNEFFFFRAGGKYGKAVVAWASKGGQLLKLEFTLFIQPDGSRNLSGSMPFSSIKSPAGRLGE